MTHIQSKNERSLQGSSWSFPTLELVHTGHKLTYMATTTKKLPASIPVMCAHFSPFSKLSRSTLVACGIPYDVTYHQEFITIVMNELLIPPELIAICQGGPRWASSCHTSQITYPGLSLHSLTTHSMYLQPSMNICRIHKDHNSHRERWDTKWSWYGQESQCNRVHFDVKFTWIHAYIWDHLYSYTKCPHADYVITQGHKSRSGRCDGDWTNNYIMLGLAQVWW